jgi:ankyrin repeat protein
VKEALATGALDVNDTDSKGDTLLHMAARNGHKAIVKEVRPRHAPAAVAECTRTS